MTLLLDTHAFLWWSTDARRLKTEARQAIGNADQVFVSAASAWEAAIKVGLGRLQLDIGFEEAVEENDFRELPIGFRHAAAASALPPHHADPFDRMLIAQARVEGFTVVTHDAWFRPYDVSVLWT